MEEVLFIQSGENTFAYAGIYKGNEREVKNFYIKKNSENNELCRVQIDEQVNLITPYFDRESKLLYTVGKR